MKFCSDCIICCLTLPDARSTAGFPTLKKKKDLAIYFLT